MGGFSNARDNNTFSSPCSSGSSSPKTPTLVPTIVKEEEDPVPLLFLDDADFYNTDDFSAGIEDDFVPIEPASEPSEMGTVLSTPPPKLLRPALRKPSSTSSTSSSTSSQKFRKLVRFLDRVEVHPAIPLLPSPPATPRSPPPLRSKKQKISQFKAARKPSTYDENARYPSPPPDVTLDPAITAGLGRAGSPNRSPTPSPTSSTTHLAPPPAEYDTRYLSPPTTPPRSPPPSWRVPPASLNPHAPHVQSPPRVRSPVHADDEVDLGIHIPSPPSSPTMVDMRRGVEYIRAGSPKQWHPPEIHSVIARQWVKGEVRFEDQWGRRLIPVPGQEGRGEEAGGFRFDLWPVEEDVVHEREEGRGAWVRGRRGYRSARV